jgi:hypothetical protein
MRCCQVDVRDLINFCYFGKCIGVEKLAILKDPYFAIFDVIAFTNMDFSMASSHNTSFVALVSSATIESVNLTQK